MDQKLKWVDTHCHIMDNFGTSEEFSETPEEIAKKIEEELLFAVTIGTELADNERIFNITQTHKNLYGTLGTHPVECLEYKDETGNHYIKWLKESSKIVGIGEIGLDYYKNEIDKKIQKSVFIKQLQIAQDHNMPVVIHSRHSIDDCLEILKDFQKIKNIVFHCFTGTKKEAEMILNLDYYLSFTGVITFKKTDDLKDIVKLTPLSQLMIETDSPYLAPEPNRGKTNSPLWVHFVGEKVAEIKEMDVIEINRVMNQNSQRFFNISF